MTGGMRLELARLLGWRRWLGAGAVLAGAALVISDQLMAEGERRVVNQWDVVMTGLNQSITVPFLLVPLFVALVGDVLIADRHAPFALLSVPRAPSRGRWWMWKLGALAAAALLFALLAAFVFAAIGALRTRVGWAFSTFAAAPRPLLNRFFAPPPIGVFPPGGILLVAGYFGLALAAYAAPIMAVSLWWPRPWLPLAISLALAMVFYRVPVTNMFHPVGNLIWSMHSLTLGYGVAIRWWASATFFAAELAGAYLIGRLVLATGDL